MVVVLLFLVYLSIFVKISYSIKIDLPYVDIKYHPNYDLLPNKECGYSNDEDRIIGGTTASMGEYPWIARLGYKIENCSDLVDFKCGGALLTKRHVVTAAHCVTDLGKSHCNSQNTLRSLKLYLIRLGEYSVETNPDCDENGVCAKPVQDILVSKVTVHSYYNNPKHRNDIALITLEKPATFTEWVLPVCLIRGENVNKKYINDIGLVAGWGISDWATRNKSRELEHLKVPIRDPNMCVIVFGNLSISTRSQICAGGIKGEDSCDGDSGGPLIVIQETEIGPRYSILGLVSFGFKKCAYRPYPAIYTNVMFYGTWLLNQIND